MLYKILFVIFSTTIVDDVPRTLESTGMKPWKSLVGC